MDRSIEIVTLERGLRRSMRTLSKRHEHRSGGYAACAAAAIAAAGFLSFALLTWAAGFVLQAPTFFLTAFATVGGAGACAWRRSTVRARRYRIGPCVDDDAFSADGVDLVSWCPDRGYELALLHGMTGIIDDGGMRRPIEAITVRNQVVRVAIGGAVARIEMAQTTFVVQPAT